MTKRLKCKSAIVLSPVTSRATCLSRRSIQMPNGFSVFKRNKIFSTKSQLKDLSQFLPTENDDKEF